MPLSTTAQYTIGTGALVVSGFVGAAIKAWLDKRKPTSPGAPKP